MRSLRTRETGFTLIELLVVLVIIGVVVTFATLSLNPTGPGDRLDTAARRLLALTQDAADEAILSGQTIGLQLGDHGYRFIRLSDRGWQVISAADSPLRPRRLDDDIHLDRVNSRGERDRHSRQVDTLMLPVSPIAGRQPGESPVQDNRDAADQQLAMPAALFLSSGELLPFTLELSAEGVDRRYRISGAPNGEIALKPVDR
ncbi:type II secretion system minor pseudopilin GspH [Salinisphaera sp.]|uniref:type II secretion system minor pseudopilin GspH n=1 Tax=Salinisphaera sp. TaxID=1914330 RepID=UPI002D76821A|nr:type II secretion system minor pseudopilin GspH [Salinisphaera sp.]HET7315516.1 type II secretion system minor pseudopilin GspH [Salinisphaera sp.]